MSETAVERNFDLRAYLVAEGAAVEAALERAAGRFSEVAQEEVVNAARHGVLSGGKRLRPILCATAFRACGGATDDARLYDFAIGVELVHAYSLIHDDLPSMDDAELRRGQPTTHRVHGVLAATLAGVGLIPLAAAQVLRAAKAAGIPDEAARRCADILLGASGAGGMVGGQGLDLLGEGQALGSDDLTELHRHKTGALLTASLEMGAVAAGASAETRAALTAYGRHVGLAFQIADDVLDATATAEELGKRPSDADLDKSTYVSLHGLEGARRLARRETDAATDALRAGGITAPALFALAEYIVERRS